MRRHLITALSLVGIFAATTAPATAQSFKSSIGWNAGALFATSLNDGASGGEGLVDLKPDVTWAAGVHYDHWTGAGHIGFRVQGGLARQELDWIQGPRGIYVYTADLDLMLRPAAPTPGRTLLPFLAGGVGLIRWELGTGSTTTFNSAGASYAGDEKFQLVALGGLGFDYVTPFQWGEGPVVIRLEGRDHIQFDSPFDPINPEASDFGMIHNISVVLGFHTGMGLLGGER